MPHLIITSHLGAMMKRMPHRIYINGQHIGLMTIPSVRVEMPAGSYDVRIQSTIPLFSSTATVRLQTGLDTHLDFASRERVWDVLFSIDIALCIVKLFVAFPSPWNWIYKVLTNGFFIVWLIYEWTIRHRYFRLDTYTTLPSTTTNPN